MARSLQLCFTVYSRHHHYLSLYLSLSLPLLLLRRPTDKSQRAFAALSQRRSHTASFSQGRQSRLKTGVSWAIE